MDFRLSTEQAMLRDGARRYFSEAQRAGQQAATQDHQDWLHAADAGWLAMPVPESQDGLGSGMEDIAVLCEEIGYGLASVPFIGGALLPAMLLSRCAPGSLRDELLAGIASALSPLAVAILEPGRRYSLCPEVRARADADGQIHVDGQKVLVAGGATTQRLIVSVQMNGMPALVSLEVGATGVLRRCYELIDGTPVADFSFTDVVLPESQVLASANSIPELLEAALDDARIGVAADLLGAMDRAISLTVDYLKLRRQFGRPLAEFQVLQHAVAEMAMDADSARSIVYRALASRQGDAGAHRRAVAGAMIKVIQSAKAVTGMAVHLHGGIGMTCEYPVGQTLRRVMVAERLFGDAEGYLARYLS